MNLIAKIGRIVHDHRLNRGLSLLDLSEQMEISIFLLTQLENGDPECRISTAKLDRIADLFGLDSFALMRGEDKPAVPYINHAERWTVRIALLMGEKEFAEFCQFLRDDERAADDLAKECQRLKD